MTGDRERLRELAEINDSGMQSVADEEKFRTAASPQAVLSLLQQLSATAAARDEACDIAEEALVEMGGPMSERQRIAELRKVGAP